MKLQDFDYDLAKEFIAQYPLAKRDQARLLVIDRKSQRIYHDKFSNILEYLPHNSLIVLNDTKVIPARLIGKRQTGGRVEVFLLKPLSDGYSYKTLIRPLKRLNINEKIIFNGAKIYASLKDPIEKIVRFNTRNVASILKLGMVPLPPYIKRQPQDIDKTHYQTVYARNNGSVASPTAGLHFTKEMLSKIRKSGIKTANVTLHVNYATFNPVKEDDIRKHRMHSEEFIAPKKTISEIKKAKAEGNQIIAVGTTSFRVLETIADKMDEKEIKAETNLFVYPGYRTKLVDALITNFHLPKTTLFMLVCAFAGTDLIKSAYNEAIARKYRFYSYGDCMLII
ncbi:MAG TPA: tRNA preQ1(34) S-adenosylmethionine ribosyltransferase-isomerase QueA [Candidatus Omnitrophota bacterium]|nr:tRNA preQ1(34) S-adenosylmethionine ribosyltransferase-isomerase QueA [Candidatus Omnitrophota bacterium]